MMSHMRQIRLMMVITIVVASTQFALTAANDIRPVTPKDYGKWETLGSGRRFGPVGGALSPDGTWLVYPIKRNNEKNELRLHDWKKGTMRVLARGANQNFSRDSRWLGYLIKVPPKERKKLEKQKKSAHDKFGLINLATGDSSVVNDVTSFAFSGDSRFVAMRHYPSKGQEHKGSDLVVQDLNAGTRVSFGNVSEYAWQEDGALLAFIIDTENRTGNGLQLFNAATGQLKILDSKDAFYAGLTWRKKGDDLAALRAEKNENYQDSTHVIIAWRKLATNSPVWRQFDQTKMAGFDKDTRIVSTRSLEWSKDGKSLFFATKEWLPKPQEKNDVEGESKKEGEDDVEAPALQIWHSKDVRVIPEQKLRAERKREDSYLVVWHVDKNKYVQLGDELTEITRVQADANIVLGLDATPYEFDGMFGRPNFDFYTIDIEDGKKVKFVTRAHVLHSISPDGENVAYLKDDHYYVYNFKSDKHLNLTTGIASSFVDKEDDHPVEQKPPYGFAGWAKDGQSFLANTKYDVWQLAIDGSGSRQITNGEADKVIHRYVKLDQEEDYVDTKKPIYVSQYGEWTKEYGYAHVTPGRNLTRVIWQEAYVSGLIRAKDTDTFAYIVEDFEDSPDYFVAQGDLSRGKQISNTNPFQKDYAWGKSELIEFTNHKGQKLQGALFYPANYESGKKFPMITYMYEILSNTVHRYAVPSERNYYNHTVWTSQGYFVLRPDIVFEPGNPGFSSVRTLERAVKTVVDMGLIDEKRVGVIGHSWGGYQTAFAVTQTDVFAAGVAGAGITNIISMYGTIGWSGRGRPENSHNEVGQDRMIVPPWENPESFISNSPVMNVHKINTPLLIEAGEEDGNVDWRQALEYYNAARRAGKHLVMLAYAKEGHGLRQEKNQVDYHRRILQWFGHYLKDEPALPWIVEGVPYLEQQKQLKNWSKE